MWSIDTLWFDVAIVALIFAVGNILFGHFEEHRPKARRVLKFGVFLVATVVLSYNDLRWIAYGGIGLLGLAMAYIHFYWLPSHGVNGWTAEPRERYYELIGARRSEAQPYRRGRPTTETGSAELGAPESDARKEAAPTSRSRIE